MVALHRGQHPGPVERPAVELGPSAGRLGRESRQQAAQPLASLLDVAVRQTRTTRAPPRGAGPARRSPAPRTSAARRAGCRAPAPGARTRSPAPARRARRSAVSARRSADEDVPTVDGARLAALVQALQRVLADGLQHQVPGLAVRRLLLAQQALLDQRLDAVQDVELRAAAARPTSRPGRGGSPAQTASAASSVQPRKTASRRNSACSSGSSRS